MASNLNSAGAMSDESDEDVLHNNAPLNDELMGNSSDGDEVSGNEHDVGEQVADYGDLERVLLRQQRRSDMQRQQGPSATTVEIQASQGCRRRSVNGIRLFTTLEAGRRRGEVRNVRACAGGGSISAVPDCMATVEDIIAVGSQGAASAFSPFVTTSNHISRPSTESPPCRRRPRGSIKRGTWTDSQLHDALAAVDGGMSMKKASDLHHIPYSSFREWYYGSRISRKLGPPAVLSPSEEKQLVDYCIRMCEMGQGLTPIALKLKVYDITKSRPTPFRNGIPGKGWMRWWRHRHPELSLRVSQTLETARARGLCAENIKSFYDNLQSLLTLHQYSADRIWNCDESGAQAGRNGGGVVIARKGARHVHSIVPDQREWLSVLVCINADGVNIPSFYVFRGTRFRQNYIERCEPGATMAMQPRAWMTAYLFSAWLSHFIESVQGMGGISAERRHLLILDGHGSHCTLEVVREARDAGLDILTLPAHTSHALQPLDVSVFKSFKQNFRAYRDFWTSRNLSQPATKSTLAHWVHLALRKSLTKENITSGFRGTGIYPINPAAMNSHLAPSEIFALPTEIAADISTHSSHELDIPVSNEHAPMERESTVVHGGEQLDYYFICLLCNYVFYSLHESNIW